MQTITDRVVAAWQFIFEHHPNADNIMHDIIETPEIVTTRRFEKWYQEAMESK